MEYSVVESSRDIDLKNLPRVENITRAEHRRKHPVSLSRAALPPLIQQNISVLSVIWEANRDAPAPDHREPIP
ncbi:MAG: hypothetical protein ACR2K5_14785 [Pseudolabrys sp.]